MRCEMVQRARHAVALRRKERRRWRRQRQRQSQRRPPKKKQAAATNSTADSKTNSKPEAMAARPALRDRPLQNRWLIQIQRRRPQLRAGGTPALQGQLQRRHVCITGRSRCIASAITSVYFRAEPVLKRTTRSLG